MVGEQLLRPARPAVAGEVGVHDRHVVEREPVRGERPPDAGEPVGHGGEDRRPGDHPDPPVPELEQVRGHGGAGGLVVGPHGVGGEVVAADHGDPPAALLERGEHGVGLRLQRGVGVAGAGHDDRVGAVGDERADLVQLGLGVAPRVADLHGQPALGGDPDDPARDLREVGVADLVHDQADGGGRAARERARVDVGDVAHLHRHLAHVRGDRLADARAARQRPRRRGDRDARARRDVGEPGRRAGFGHRFSLPGGGGVRSLRKRLRKALTFLDEEEIPR